MIFKTFKVHEAIVKGIHTVNVRGGICEISLIPQNDCMCGARDTTLKTTATEEKNEIKFDFLFMIFSDSNLKNFSPQVLLFWPFPRRQ